MTTETCEIWNLATRSDRRPFWLDRIISSISPCSFSITTYIFSHKQNITIFLYNTHGSFHVQKTVSVTEVLPLSVCVCVGYQLPTIQTTTVNTAIWLLIDHGTLWLSAYTCLRNTLNYLLIGTQNTDTFYILLFCNFVLILLYQSSHSGCHISLNRCHSKTQKKISCCMDVCVFYASSQQECTLAACLTTQWLGVCGNIRNHLWPTFWYFGIMHLVVIKKSLQVTSTWKSRWLRDDKMRQTRESTLLTATFTAEQQL